MADKKQETVAEFFARTPGAEDRAFGPEWSGMALNDGPTLKDLLCSIGSRSDVTEDPLVEHLDVQHTTVGNVIKSVIKDKYSQNLDLRGLKEGVIVKIIKDPNLFDYSPKYDLIYAKKDWKGANNVPPSSVRYKVYIRGAINKIGIVPATLQDTNMCAMQDYTIGPALADQELNVGHAVYVDDKTNLIIAINKESSTPLGAGQYAAKGYALPSTVMNTNAPRIGRAHV